MRLLSLLVLLTGSTCVWAAEDATDLALSIEPRVVYLERVPEGQALNFELLLKNDGNADLDIDRIEVSVFDARDRLLLRRFVDDNGVRPSVQTLGERTVAKGQTLAVFNPFHTFASELPIARLRYDIDLSNADGSRALKRSAEVLPVAYRNPAALRLPLRGRIINYDGHDFLGHHRRFDVHAPPIAAMGFTANFMRYSYDFVPVNGKGDMVAGDFDKNDAWLGFGAPIHAVADGTVIAVVSDQPDNRRFDESKLASNRMVLFGNYVVIDHGGGEFAVYAHARQDSVSVRTGQRVRQGDAIARIGASGSAFFPHLHFQLQSGPDTNAEGLPSYFDHFARVIGDRKLARTSATVDTGEIVESD